MSHSDLRIERHRRVGTCPSPPKHNSVSNRLTEVARRGRWPKIAPFASDLLGARSLEELKRHYRRGLLHFGFAGFGFWGGRPDNRFRLTGLSDLPERYGDYVGQRPAAMQAVFDRFGDWQRQIDNRWKKSLIQPALECLDAPSEVRPIHAALCASVADFGGRPYRDVLIVPIGDTSAAANDVHHAHLPMLSQAASSDLVAGISLTKIFDCLSHQLLESSAEQGNGFGPAGRTVELNDREKTVLRSAASGMTRKQIAETTGMRPGEVRYCLESVRQRYGFATNIQAIVQAAREHGWTV